MRPPKGASSSTDYRCSRYTLYVVVALVIAAVVAMLVKAVTK